MQRGRSRESVSTSIDDLSADEFSLCAAYAYAHARSSGVAHLQVGASLGLNKVARRCNGSGRNSIDSQAPDGIKLQTKLQTMMMVQLLRLRFGLRYGSVLASPQPEPVVMPDGGTPVLR